MASAVKRVSVSEVTRDRPALPQPGAGLAESPQHTDGNRQTKVADKLRQMGRGTVRDEGDQRNKDRVTRPVTPVALCCRWRGW